MTECIVNTVTTLERVVITFEPDQTKKGASVCYRTTVTSLDGTKMSDTVSDPMPIAFVKGEDEQRQLRKAMGEVATDALVLLDRRDAEIAALKAELQTLRDAAMQSISVAGADRLRRISEAVAADSA